MGMFDSAIDKAMASAQPMFDQLKAEFEAVHSALVADTAQDAQTQQTNEALMEAVAALTHQVNALRSSMVAANKLARAHPAP